MKKNPPYALHVSCRLADLFWTLPASFRGDAKASNPESDRWIGQAQNKLEIPDRRALRVVRNDQLYFACSTACQPMSRRQNPSGQRMRSTAA